VNPETAEFEIKESRRGLSELIAKEVTSFSYPGGALNERMTDLVKASGYSSARTTRPFCVTLADAFSQGVFRIGCTMQAKRKPLLTKNALTNDAYYLRSPWVLQYLRKFASWKALAKSLFDIAYAKGGVFHLWGHSWEIEKNSDWNTLDAVLSYVGGRSDVAYETVTEFAADSRGSTPESPASQKIL
jgi:peptidoglycan-N-acetylglucosamine deacetylase